MMSVPSYVVGFSNIISSTIVWERPKVAHILAFNSKGSLPILWEQNPPNFILAQLADDVTIIWN